MIKMIVTDPAKLKIKAKSTADYSEETKIVRDLLDTANHHHHTCLGLSANQIGYYVPIFVIRKNDTYTPIINPIVLARMGGIKSQVETCLSLPDKRTIKKRYKIIKLRYFDGENNLIEEKFKGLTARVVQHEMDHLEGILI